VVLADTSARSIVGARSTTRTNWSDTMTKTEQKLTQTVNAAQMWAKIDLAAGRTEAAEKRLTDAYAKVYGTSRGISAMYAGELLARLNNYAFINDLIIAKGDLK